MLVHQDLSLERQNKYIKRMQSESNILWNWAEKEGLQGTEEVPLPNRDQHGLTHSDKKHEEAGMIWLDWQRPKQGALKVGFFPAWRKEKPKIQ